MTDPDDWIARCVKAERERDDALAAARVIEREHHERVAECARLRGELARARQLMLRAHVELGSRGAGTALYRELGEAALERELSHVDQPTVRVLPKKDPCVNCYGGDHDACGRPCCCELARG